MRVGHAKEPNILEKQVVWKFEHWDMDGYCACMCMQQLFWYVSTTEKHVTIQYSAIYPHRLHLTPSKLWYQLNFYSDNDKWKILK